VKGEGLKGAAVDEGCSRVMKDRAKMDGGGNGINRAQQARCLHHGRNAK
jgi:hypothetical protein